AVWNDPAYPNSLTMAPPNHGKSTCFNLGQMVWDVANDPDGRCLVLTGTDDLAKQSIAQVRHALRSKYFRAIHPHIRVLGRAEDTEDSKRRFTVTRKNWSSREPTFEAAGIQSAINGRGYERIYIDDPCDPRFVNQPSYRKAVNDSFEQVIEERLRDRERAQIRITCTPWHPNDLAGKIRSEVAQGKRRDWRIASDEFAVKDDADGRPISLWPERFDSDYYAQQREIKTTATWRRLYQLRASSDDEKIVSRLHFYPEQIGSGPVWDKAGPDLRKKYSEGLAAVHNGEQWLSIDPSGSTGRGSSKIGVTHWSLTARGKGYLVNAWEFPGNPVAVQQWIVAAVCGGKWPDETDDATKQWTLPRKIDHVLFEWAGGPVGTVVLWEDYIRRTIRQIDPKAEVKLRRATIRGRGGGQNRDKLLRLADAAAYLEGSFVKLPGQLTMSADGKCFDIICSDREPIVNLVHEILNPDSRGHNDLMDSVTQWVRELSPRFVHDEETAKAEKDRRKKSWSVRTNDSPSCLSGSGRGRIRTAHTERKTNGCGRNLLPDRLGYRHWHAGFRLRHAVARPDSIGAAPALRRDGPRGGRSVFGVEQDATGFERRRSSRPPADDWRRSAQHARL
ncbi:MAG: hypothetical protein ABH877_01700, partial [bacterium]